MVFLKQPVQKMEQPDPTTFLLQIAMHKVDVLTNKKMLKKCHLFKQTPILQNLIAILFETVAA